MELRLRPSKELLRPKVGVLPHVAPVLVERRPFATPQGRTIFASTTLSAQHRGYIITCDLRRSAIRQTAFSFLAKLLGCYLICLHCQVSRKTMID